MLHIGGQLYNLTNRDVQSIFLEPKFFQATFTLGAGVTQSNQTVPLAMDRSYWIHSVVIRGLAETLTTWDEWTIDLRDSGSNRVATLARQRIAGAANTAFVSTVPIGFAVPPQTSALQLTFTRGGATNAVDANYSINGYYIPAGGIARF
jgi:hypothetical protein